mmetsp:Transcript_13226/g.35109  ORF Transcript_13226/g.35109 Transcript_13226/m.35109 type:complete len:492 (+) Transcript_13226:133-1608(+)
MRWLVVAISLPAATASVVVSPSVVVPVTVIVPTIAPIVSSTSIPAAAATTTVVSWVAAAAAAALSPPVVVATPIVVPVTVVVHTPIARVVVSAIVATFIVPAIVAVTVTVVVATTVVSSVVPTSFAAAAAAMMLMPVITACASARRVVAPAFAATKSTSKAHRPPFGHRAPSLNIHDDSLPLDVASLCGAKSALHVILRFVLDECIPATLRVRRICVGSTTLAYEANAHNLAVLAHDSVKLLFCDVFAETADEQRAERFAVAVNVRVVLRVVACERLLQSELGVAPPLLLALLCGVACSLRLSRRRGLSLLACCVVRILFKELRERRDSVDATADVHPLRHRLHVLERFSRREPDEQSRRQSRLVLLACASWRHARGHVRSNVVPVADEWFRAVCFLEHFHDARAYVDVGHSWCRTPCLFVLLLPCSPQVGGYTHRHRRRRHGWRERHWERRDGSRRERRRYGIIQGQRRRRSRRRWWPGRHDIQRYGCCY